MSVEELLALQCEVEWTVRDAGVSGHSPPAAPVKVARFRKLIALARYEVTHGRGVDPGDAAMLRELALEIGRIFGARAAAIPGGAYPKGRHGVA